MRLYEVRAGDSPASIAATYAGCPRCSRDMIAVNAHKPAITKPNGYRTFKNLQVGEKINLPDKWFNGDLDRLPASYFAQLPHHDGVTPTPGRVGALGDPASDAVAALSLVDDRTFSMGVGPATTLIDQSVAPADGSSNPGVAAYASATHIATASARQHNQDLQAALDAGNQPAVTAARQNVQADLTAAVASAGLALQAIYGGPSAPPSIPVPPMVIPGSPSLSGLAAAAQAAISAAGSGFCTAVAQPGSAANTAIHAFKTAWNSANPGNPVPINTGTYDAQTAAAITQLLGSAPAACATRPAIMPPPGVMPPQTDTGLSTGDMIGFGVLGAGVIGGAIYFMMQKPTGHVRRVRAHAYR